jgi:hypothetical protein
MDEQALLEGMREYHGPKGDLWVLDESLRDRAEALAEKFSEDLAHVDLKRVVFVRAKGVKGKWLGRCNYVGSTPSNPLPLVVRYVLSSLAEGGLLEIGRMKALSNVEMIDLRYIITLNETALKTQMSGICKESDPDYGLHLSRLETITLYHELLHIRPGMDGNVGHDTQDFAKVLARFGVHWTSGIVEEDAAAEVDDTAAALNGLNIDPKKYGEV